MPTAAEKRAEFRRLHERGCFVIPNPWDAGSARMLQGLGFKALASTSSGMAWSMGVTDYEVELEPVLAHLATLCAASDLPLNADFENGFADEPQGVAQDVTLDDTKLTGNAMINYSSCAIRRALQGSALPIPLTERSWVQVY